MSAEDLAFVIWPKILLISRLCLIPDPSDWPRALWVKYTARGLQAVGFLDSQTEGASLPQRLPWPEVERTEGGAVSFEAGEGVFLELLLQH